MRSPGLLCILINTEGLESRGAGCSAAFLIPRASRFICKPKLVRPAALPGTGSLSEMLELCRPTRCWETPHLQGRCIPELGTQSLFLVTTQVTTGADLLVGSWATFLGSFGFLPHAGVNSISGTEVRGQVSRVAFFYSFFMFLKIYLFT